MEDGEIVRLFFERSEQAVAEAMAKYKGYCTKIALNILYSREDAEECVNDAFMKLWEQIPPNKPEILSIFIGTITRNLAINRYKQALTQKRGNGEAAMAFEELDAVISDNVSIETEAERRELLDEINKFLRKLPEKKRNIFICRYWYCDSLRDIAARFSVSESNVSVILNRTRGALREYLQKRGF